MEESNTTPTSQKSQFLPFVIIVGFIAIAFLTFRSISPSLNTKSPVSPETPSPATTGAGQDNKNNAEVTTIEVEAGSFYYKPNEIRVKKGEKVKIVLNSVSMMHDFVIDDLKVKSPIIKSGETGTVEFVADKAGTFEYYCSVGQHRQQGQVGKLIVE